MAESIHASRAAKQWILHDFLRNHSNVEAFWVFLEPPFTLPWVLALFVHEWGNEVMIASPHMTFTELPTRRADWEDVGWPPGEGVCLSYRHYSDLILILQLFSDGSGGAGVDVAENPSPSNLELTVPAPVIAEYLACLALDSTQWRTRPGWTYNPVPYDHFADMDAQGIEIRDPQWRAAQTAWVLNFCEALAHPHPAIPVASDDMDTPRHCSACGQHDLALWYTGTRWGETLCEACYSVRIRAGTAKAPEADRPS